MNPHPDLFKMDRSATLAYKLHLFEADLAPPKKLHRSLGTDLPCIPR